VVVGQGYSTISWIPEEQGSWALPLVLERISSFETPTGKIAQQLRLVCTQIPGKMLFLGDGEYDYAPFLKSTADIDCLKLLRLRPNRLSQKTLNSDDSAFADGRLSTSGKQPTIPLQ
jgi:hypothetical protein